MYLSPLGEDTLVLCDACGYAQNRQVATSRKAQAAPEEPREARRVETPHATTIEELAAMLGVEKARTAKMVFLAAEQRGESGKPVVRLVVGVVRGDTDLNEAKLSNLLGGAELRPMTLEEIASIGAAAGFASPIGLTGGEVVADELVMSSPNLVAGANEEGWHLLDVNAGATGSRISSLTSSRPTTATGAPSAAGRCAPSAASRWATSSSSGPSTRSRSGPPTWTRTGTPSQS